MADKDRYKPDEEALMRYPIPLIENPFRYGYKNRGMEEKTPPLSSLPAPMSQKLGPYTKEGYELLRASMLKTLDLDPLYGPEFNVKSNPPEDGRNFPSKNLTSISEKQGDPTFFDEKGRQTQIFDPWKGYFLPFYMTLGLGLTAGTVATAITITGRIATHFVVAFAGCAVYPFYAIGKKGEELKYVYPTTPQYLRYSLYKWAKKLSPSNLWRSAALSLDLAGKIPASQAVKRKMDIEYAKLAKEWVDKQELRNSLEIQMTDKVSKWEVKPHVHKYERVDHLRSRLAITEWYKNTFLYKAYVKERQTTKVPYGESLPLSSHWRVLTSWVLPAWKGFIRPFPRRFFKHFMRQLKTTWRSMFIFMWLYMFNWFVWHLLVFRWAPDYDNPKFETVRHMKSIPYICTAFTSYFMMKGIRKGEAWKTLVQRVRAIKLRQVPVLVVGLTFMGLALENFIEGFFGVFFTRNVYNVPSDKSPVSYYSPNYFKGFWEDLKNLPDDYEIWKKHWEEGGSPFRDWSSPLPDGRAQPNLGNEALGELLKKTLYPEMPQQKEHMKDSRLTAYFEKHFEKVDDGRAERVVQDLQRKMYEMKADKTIQEELKAKAKEELSRRS